jgi:hypothetical protein
MRLGKAQSSGDLRVDVLAVIANVLAGVGKGLSKLNGPTLRPHDGLMFRLAGELKVRSSSDREAAALRADLDFAGLTKPRSAMRFDGVIGHDPSALTGERPP